MTNEQEWDFDNLTQQQLATMFGVDRTTVRNWQNAGMPYNPPTGKGQKANYSMGVCFYWRVGHKLGRELDIKLTQLQKIAFAYISGHEDCGFDKGDLKLYQNLMKRAGVSRKDQTLIELGSALQLISQYTNTRINLTF